jgi:hypothetical protein
VFRKKYTIRLQEQEEHIESLVVKLNNIEKQKSRLQSEVEVLIIDLEKVKSIFIRTLFIDYLRIPFLIL